MDDPPRDHEQQEQDGEAVGERRAPGQVEREQPEQRLHRDALQAVGAAGDRRRLVGDLGQQERDAERHHQARQVGAAQHEEARREARERGDRRADGETQQRIAAQPCFANRPAAYAPRPKNAA